MPDWFPSVEYPKCGSRDIRFIKLHQETSIYECNVCGCLFELEEGEQEA
jgi:predicted adenine nucleotide alpha hydrolase (AANH) superfamily ATPase